jgi:superfamily I DNA/RNA helicase
LKKNVRSDVGVQDFAAGILAGNVCIGDSAAVEMIPCETLSDVISALATMDDEIVLTPHNKTRIELNKAVQLRTWARVEEIDIVLTRTLSEDAKAGLRGIARIHPSEANKVHVRADNGTNFTATLSAAIDMVSVDCRAGGLQAEAGCVIISGDRVIVTKNTASACNGDIGVYTHSRVVKFPDHEALIPEISDSDPGMTLAYCVTVHKAQGSEFDTVVVPVTNTSAWDRTLLYTAVTRAKKRVVILGTVDDLTKIVQCVLPARTSILRAML